MLTDIIRHRRRAEIQAEFFRDLWWHRELHRSCDLVAESVDELDGRGHPAAIGVGLQAHRAQARVLQDGCRGQSVVPCTDNDRVRAMEFSFGRQGSRNMSVLTQICQY